MPRNTGKEWGVAGNSFCSDVGCMNQGRLGYLWIWLAEEEEERGG
jgi:hypothetical protein